MNLRPYQNKSVEAIHTEWEQGRRKTLLVLPTGTGKTICFSKITEDQVNAGEKVLQLAHREELLTQAADKLKATTGLDAAIEKAEQTSVGTPFPVTIGSVQTMCRKKRLEQFPSDAFGTIIIDEAHHALSKSYQTVLEHFPDAKVLGVTATPDRGDRKNLGEYFDSTAYEYSMAQAVKDGYLVPIKAQMIPLNIDISSVGITSGDYNAGEVGYALEPYLEAIAYHMSLRCRDRKTVVFLPLVRISQMFCEMLKKHGFRAMEVNGESQDRAEVLKAFDDGKINVLCNSMLLTEGWDCPSVDCVVVLRPTKVRGLYQQMVGRGTRLCEGKKDLLLLDFLWLTARHDLCRPSALVAKSEEIAEKINRAIEIGEEVDLMDQEEKAETDVLEERKKALARQLEEQKRKKAKLVDPLQYAMSIADEDLADYEPTHIWEMEPPTEKQKSMLERRGINAESVQNKGQASMIINRLMQRQEQGYATPKQIKTLERFGFDGVGNWSFERASKCIGVLASNRWQRPAWMGDDWGR